MMSIAIRGIVITASVATFAACATPDFKEAGRGPDPLELVPGQKQYYDAYMRSGGPLFYAITQDGKYSHYDYCLASTGCGITAGQTVYNCSVRAGRPCYLYAAGMNKVWKDSTSSAQAAANRSSVPSPEKPTASDKPKPRMVETINYVPPSVNTHFGTSAGGFTITETADAYIATANSANQTSKWYAGLISVPTNAVVEVEKAKTIWPLREGKSVDFLVTQGNDSWTHSLKVIGTENLVINGVSTAVMKLEDRVRSQNAAQGGFEMTRELWYSPEHKWLVKLHDTQISGPKAQTYSWQILTVR